MKKVWIITKFELFRIVNDVWYPVLYFLFPLIFLAIPLGMLWIDRWRLVELAEDWIRGQTGLKAQMTVGVVDQAGFTSLYGEYKYKNPLQQEEGDYTVCKVR